MASRPTWPGGRPNDGDPADPVPFESVARSVSVALTSKRSRFYEVRLQPTLWGGVALVRAWGRLGTPGRTAARSYADLGAARAAAERQVRRRVQRGYRLVWVH